jgi:hypothetical protein
MTSRSEPLEGCARSLLKMAARPAGSGNAGRPPDAGGAAPASSSQSQLQFGAKLGQGLMLGHGISAPGDRRQVNKARWVLRVLVNGSALSAKERITLARWRRRMAGTERGSAGVSNKKATSIKAPGASRRTLSCQRTGRSTQALIAWASAAAKRSWLAVRGVSGATCRSCQCAAVASTRSPKSSCRVRLQAKAGRSRRLATDWRVNPCSPSSTATRTTARSCNSATTS